MTTQCTSCGGFCGNICQRENVAQPEQEPVAYQDKAKLTELVAAEDWGNIDPQWHWMYQPLYTTPPQPSRNDTLEEVAKEFDKMKVFGDTAASFAIFVREMKND